MGDVPIKHQHFVAGAESFVANPGFCPCSATQAHLQPLVLHGALPVANILVRALPNARQTPDKYRPTLPAKDEHGR